MHSIPSHAPHSENTRHKVFFFLFSFLLALLPICVAEKHIIHASVLTRSLHSHQQRIQTRKTFRCWTPQTGVTHSAGGFVTGRADGGMSGCVTSSWEGLVILKDSAVAAWCKLGDSDYVCTSNGPPRKVVFKLLILTLLRNLLEGALRFLLCLSSEIKQNETPIY